MVDSSYTGFGRVGAGECFEHLPVPLLARPTTIETLFHTCKGQSEIILDQKSCVIYS
jgi:hypothetical protein